MPALGKALTLADGFETIASGWHRSRRSSPPDRPAFERCEVFRRLGGASAVEEQRGSPGSAFGGSKVRR